MSGHISAQRIEYYHQGKLAPAELLTIGEHLACCATCREQMGSADRLRRAFVALGADLETAADYEQAHLEPEQMAAYVDDQLDEVDRSIADSHLGYCEECATELLDLRRLKTALGGFAAEGTAPVRATRLARLWSSPARWLPLAAAAALLLIVWLGVMPLRNQALKLNEQVSGLEKRNDELEERLSSLSAANGQGGEENTDEPRLVALSDGGRLVTLDKQGNLAGFTSLSTSSEQLVKAVLTEQRVRTSPLIADLVGKQGVIMGPASELAGFSLRSPIGVVIESDRPTFRWSPLSGASASYAVALYDTGSREMIASGPLAATAWTPPHPLERGHIYAWEVTATRDGKEFTVPKPPAPQARFSILQQAQVDELNRARQMYPGSHLLAAILYARAGLMDEAEREFGALAAANPDSLTAQKLLRSVRAHKDQ